MSLNDTSVHRKRLARIRCLQETIKCFQSNKPLPFALCYVPSRLTFRVSKSHKLSIYRKPNLQASKPQEVAVYEDFVVITNGDDFSNSDGLWAEVLKIKDKNGTSQERFPEKKWILIYSAKPSDEDLFLVLIENKSKVHLPFVQQPFEPTTKNRWDDVIDVFYSVSESPHLIDPSDDAAVESIRNVPPCWSPDYDEDLVHFLFPFIYTDADGASNIKNFIDGIEVSSHGDEEGSECLIDGDPDTFWETDGQQGAHWIRLTMKPGVVISKLIITIDATDENYLPSEVEVWVGQEAGSLVAACKLNVEPKYPHGPSDIVVLQDQQLAYHLVEIRITHCKDDGIDTRVRGLKLKPQGQKEFGINRDWLQHSNLIRYPRLEAVDHDILCRRACVLQRFIQLLDSVLSYIAPPWEHSLTFPGVFKTVRQLLPLSAKRGILIDTFLRETESRRPLQMPELYINRRAAADHKADPSLDPDCKNSEFIQIYEGLKPRDRSTRALDYRWPSRYDQWWVCKFVSEGIIDQGGGFRDSLSDISEELCPVAADATVPLPYFIRAPNYENLDDNTNKDVYIPNPKCTDFPRYEWIGQVMGACLRGKEFLVLSLPSFVWKKLTGEEVTWSRDFMSIDAYVVKAMEMLAAMSEQEFNDLYSDITWSVTLSDGQQVDLVPGGSEVSVGYEDRNQYIKQVIHKRMTECDRQLEAIQKGLLDVVPRAALELLTWQELEKKVAGDPEISIEALKRSVHFEDEDIRETRVRYFWEAMANFSNEDRSRFLRFVTGRRRLPTRVYVGSDKGNGTDGLPEASTCANTLYLPNYTGAKICEEKLRYAVYNCLAIDTDMSPWDE